VRVSRVNGDIQIQVRDNGRGIDPQFLPHVFDRFRQADPAPARSQDGLGLGLAIVHHIIELHEGTVVAESAGPGQGATFTVRLRIRKPTPSRLSIDQPSPDDQKPATDAAKMLRDLKVLIVDDEDDVRDFLTQVLCAAGADVASAATAKDGLDLFHRLSPDVLLSDIALPGEDGYAFIREIRALSRDSGSTVRAAALTANARPEDAARALDAGFDMHIAKPVEPDELIGIVAGLAERRGRA
jgi:CheY-like chemotaxis protein